jgi:hypothetical protein
VGVRGVRSLNVLQVTTPRKQVECDVEGTGQSLQKRKSHRIASHRIASHRIASHRIASHRIASHRIASHRIASHRIASHRIASHRIAPHCNAPPTHPPTTTTTTTLHHAVLGRYVDRAVPTATYPRGGQVQRLRVPRAVLLLVPRQHDVEERGAVSEDVAQGPRHQRVGLLQDRDTRSDAMITSSLDRARIQQ